MRRGLRRRGGVRTAPATAIRRARRRRGRGRAAGLSAGVCSASPPSVPPPRDPLPPSPPRPPVPPTSRCRSPRSSGRSGTWRTSPAGHPRRCDRLAHPLPLVAVPRTARPPPGLRPPRRRAAVRRGHRRILRGPPARAEPDGRPCRVALGYDEADTLARIAESHHALNRPDEARRGASSRPLPRAGAGGRNQPRRGSARRPGRKGLISTVTKGGAGCRLLFGL